MSVISESFPPEKAWYLIYTKPRQEDTAYSNLLRQGFSVYLPKVRQSRKRRGKMETVVEPLFPRYLFIHLDAHTDNWTPIRSTIGVASLVRFGTVPGRVPDMLIDHLREQENADGLHEWAELQLQVGDRVRVIEGPLIGLEGILLAPNGHDRVVLLLELVGRECRAQFPRSQLERT